MAYATVADMLLALGEAELRRVGDFTGDIVTDDPNCTAALDAASSLMDSYFGGTVTNSPTPPVLVRCAVDIAAWMMCSEKNMITEDRQTAYDNWIEWLKGIAAGKLDPGWIILYPPTPPEPPLDAIDPGDPEVSGLQRVWSRQSARGVF